jgi:hypothetical protein
MMFGRVQYLLFYLHFDSFSELKDSMFCLFTSVLFFMLYLYPPYVSSFCNYLNINNKIEHSV